MSLDITPADADLVDPDCVDAVRPLPQRTVLLMAAACGISAANIYYNQPLLGDFARAFSATERQVGLIATASQVGYGVGTLLFVPLGDLVERRRLVMILVTVCAALLVGTALAPNLPTLIVLQLLVGVVAMSPQVLVPLAVDLSPPSLRGRTIGALMGGLLIGILLARTVSGIVADHLGWRVMFGLAACAMAGLAIALWSGLPRRAPAVTGLTYPRLMRSLITLARQHRARLLVPSLISAITFGAFAGFWTVLSFLVAERFGGGASEAGLFGIVGAIGVLGAPLSGRLSDRRGPAFTIVVAVGLALASFALMAGWSTLPGLIVGVLLMDLGIQSTSVATQSMVMSIDPSARSRLNTLFIVSRFAGGAAGSALGTWAWSHGRWGGVCATAIAALSVALVVQLIYSRRSSATAFRADATGIGHGAA